MNREEVSELLAFMAAYDRRKVGPSDVEAWQLALADVDADDARSVAGEHYRTETDWLLPAKIRKGVAAKYGLLSPNLGDAYEHAHRVAAAMGLGRGALHPAVLRAYEAMGGGGGVLADGGTTVYAQFRDMYREFAVTHDREVLAGDMRQEVAEELKRRASLKRGEQRQQLEMAAGLQQEPASEEVMQQRLKEMREALAKVKKP